MNIDSTVKDNFPMGTIKSSTMEHFSFTTFVYWFAGLTQSLVVVVVVFLLKMPLVGVFISFIVEVGSHSLSFSLSHMTAVRL